MTSLFRTCAWCKKEVAEGAEAFALGAKVRRGVDQLEGREGEFIPLELTKVDEPIYALVALSDSEAKRKGWDLVFLACSKDCARALREAVEEELEFLETWTW